MSLIPCPALSALCIEQSMQSTIVKSSDEVGWNGFLLEREVAGAGMRISDHSEQNILANRLFSCDAGRIRDRVRNRVSAQDRWSGDSNFQGARPGMHLLSDAELVYCSFDASFMDRIVDGARFDRMEFRSGLRDQSLYQLMQMLIAEFEAGNPTGKVYAETIAEALALRFVYFGSTVEIEAPPKISVLPGNKLACVKEPMDARNMRRKWARL